MSAFTTTVATGPSVASSATRVPDIGFKRRCPGYSSNGAFINKSTVDIGL